MNQLAVKPSVEYTLKVVKGPDKGTGYKIVSPTIYIGRSSDNDISLPSDNRVSRKHAVIAISSQSIQIQTLNENNPIEVDGQSGVGFNLKNKSRIKLGDSELVFEVRMLIGEEKKQLAKVNNQVATANNNPQMNPGFNPQQPGQGYKPQAPGKKLRPIHMIYIGLGFLVLLLLTSGEKKTQEEIELITSEEIETSIETAKQLNKATQKELEASGKNGQQYKQAQANYVKGFRDFKKGQYERSIDNFNACLAVFPKHILCSRYRKLASKKFQELIQYHMILGRKYFDQGQYQACKSSFKNVMNMVKSPQSKIFIEAKESYGLCRTKLEDRY